jgi:hypothetical protein
MIGINSFVLFVDGVSFRKKNDGNLASCAMRNDAVFRHFFRIDTSIHKQKINSFLKSTNIAVLMSNS